MHGAFDHRSNLAISIDGIANSQQVKILTQGLETAKKEAIKTAAKIKALEELLAIQQYKNHC
jgi:hypothetical protein